MEAILPRPLASAEENRAAKSALVTPLTTKSSCEGPVSIRWRSARSSSFSVSCAAKSAPALLPRSALASAKNWAQCWATLTWRPRRSQ